MQLAGKEKVGELLGTDKDLELMAVVAFGHPAKRPSVEKEIPSRREFFLESSTGAA